MCRTIVTLCLISRVITGVKSRDLLYSQNATRLPRSASIPSENGYVFNQFGDNSGKYAMFASEDTIHNPYTGLDPFEIKSSDKLGVYPPHYPDLPSIPDRIPSHTMNPMKYNADYEISKARSDTKYAAMTNKHTPSSIKSDIMIEKLKSMMHYAPPGMNDAFSSYETHGDYQNDDDDVRSSGRTMYDNYWPRIYHSPYEYEFKKGITEIEKAKDKRYVDEPLEVKPVHEQIDNDLPNIDTNNHNIEESTDNPIGGNGPFFSFVLNDYFDRNNEEDSISFKGLDADWGKEFDHESYRPSIEDIIINSKRDHRLKNTYYTPVSKGLTTSVPLSVHRAPNVVHTSRNGYTPTGEDISNTITPYPSYKSSYYASPGFPPTSNYYSSEINSLTDEGVKENHDSDKHQVGNTKYSNDKTEHGAKGHKYEGFRDFLDSFANKFGSEDHKSESNFEKANNVNKGEKKKGFHRVYHKDEFQEDKEFFDDSNNMLKSQEKGSSKVHIGGSEALLRSQALANVGEAANATSKYGNAGDEKLENSHKVHDGSNTKGNKFVKFIDVAKQAAKSNSADYVDAFRV